MSFDKTTPMFLAVCQRFGVDPALIAALVTVETTWNPWAVRYEPAYAYVYKVTDFARLHMFSQPTELALQRLSWGPLQVMGATARELGFSDVLTKLVDPALGLEYGVRYFLSRCARYTSVEDQIAAYNAGTARRDALTGRYVNQAYVDKVMNAYR